MASYVQFFSYFRDVNSITSDLEHHKIVLRPLLLNTVRPLVQLTICCHFFFFAQLHKLSFFLPYRRCFNSALSLSLFRLIISHLTCLVATALIVSEMLYSAINHSFCCHHHHDHHHHRHHRHDHHHHRHDHHDHDHDHDHPLFICLFIYLFIFISILLFNAKKTRQINTNTRHFSCFLRSAHLHLQIRPWDYERTTSSF